MAILCLVCGYDKNPDTADFCDVCGSELESSPAPAPVPVPTIEPIPVPAPTINLNEPPSVPSNPTIVPNTTTLQPEFYPTPPIPVPVKGNGIKLVAKQTNAPIGEFIIEDSAIIGIFDPEMGPVDIDLEDFRGKETVSRQHGEIYRQGNAWTIKDLGSTNGIFIKPAGESRFHARINSPVSLNIGDEVAIAKVIFTVRSL